MEEINLKKEELRNNKNQLKNYAYQQILHNTFAFIIRHTFNIMIIFIFPEFKLLNLINFFYFLTISINDFNVITSDKLIKSIRYGINKKRINELKEDIYNINQEIKSLHYQEIIEDAKKNPMPIFSYDELVKSNEELKENSKGFQKVLKK